MIDGWFFVLGSVVWIDSGSVWFGLWYELFFFILGYVGVLKFVGW